jgi:hypothetical protein
MTYFTTSKVWGPFPYMLISSNGNLIVVYWQERRGDPYGDAESFHVQLVPSKITPDNDILFLGGYHSTESFMAMRRLDEEDVAGSALLKY